MGRGLECGGFGDAVECDAGGEDALDGAVAGVTDRDGPRARCLQSPIADGLAKREDSWALRSRWMALMAMNSAITSTHADPTSEALRRHQVGLRRVKAIFSAGSVEVGGRPHG